MGLEQTVRFSILCHESDLEDIVNFLSEKKVFHPESISEAREPEESGIEIEQDISRITFVISQVEKVSASEKGIRASIEDLRPEMSISELHDITVNFDFRSVYADVVTLSEKKEELIDRLTEIEGTLARLQFFKETSIKKKYLLTGEDSQVVRCIVSLKKTRYEEFVEKINDLVAVFELTAEESRVKNLVVLFILAHRTTESELNQILSELGASFIEVPQEMEDEETFKDFFQRQWVKKAEIKRQIENLDTRIASYASQINNLKALLELKKLELEKFKAKEKILMTERSRLISGWVPENAAASLKKEIEENYIASCDIDRTSGEPFKPVILKNRGIFRSLQLLTELYGVPSAQEIDPTPLMAPWFLLYFGFCIGDAGYGLLLLLIGYWLKRFFRLKESIESFADIFMLGGVGAIIIGVLTGSYFAIDSRFLPGFAKSVVILDPINNPTSMLVLSLVFGIFQLSLGIALNAYMLIRFNRNFQAFLSEAGKLFFIWGGVFLVAGFLGKKMFSSLEVPGKYLLLTGAFLILLFSASEIRSVIRRILAGAYNIYGLTSYLGDAISYARLMALMLSGVLIGMAVNILAGLATELLGLYAGIIVAIVILVAGHTFNLLMSIVSAFVHSMRLQFVEFFKQFYTDGGRKFKPLWFSEEYIKITDRR